MCLLILRGTSQFRSSEKGTAYRGSWWLIPSDIIIIYLVASDRSLLKQEGGISCKGKRVTEGWCVQQGRNQFPGWWGCGLGSRSLGWWLWQHSSRHGKECLHHFSWATLYRSGSRLGSNFMFFKSVSDCNLIFYSVFSPGHAQESSPTMPRPLTHRHWVYSSVLVNLTMVSLPLGDKSFCGLTRPELWAFKTEGYDTTLWWILQEICHSIFSWKCSKWTTYLSY